MKYVFSLFGKFSWNKTEFADQQAWHFAKCFYNQT